MLARAAQVDEEVGAERREQRLGEQLGVAVGVGLARAAASRAGGARA